MLRLSMSIHRGEVGAVVDPSTALYEWDQLANDQIGQCKPRMRSCEDYMDEYSDYSIATAGSLA